MRKSNNSSTQKPDTETNLKARKNIIGIYYNIIIKQSFTLTEQVLRRSGYLYATKSWEGQVIYMQQEETTTKAKAIFIYFGQSQNCGWLLGGESWNGLDWPHIASSILRHNQFEAILRHTQFHNLLLVWLWTIESVHPKP